MAKRCGWCILTLCLYLFVLEGHCTTRQFWWNETLRLHLPAQGLLNHLLWWGGQHLPSVLLTSCRMFIPKLYIVLLKLTHYLWDCTKWNNADVLIYVHLLSHWLHPEAVWLPRHRVPCPDSRQRQGLPVVQEGQQVQNPKRYSKMFMVEVIVVCLCVLLLCA